MNESGIPDSLHPLLDSLNHEEGALGFFAPPLEQNLWRFMSLSKFLDLLEKQSLYFARADCLGDDYEGTMPQPMADLWNELQKTILNSIKSETGESSEASSPSSWARYRRRFFVSCWHMSSHESHAMWQIYSALQEAVAIRTTVSALHRNIKIDRGVRYIGKVMYFDFHDNSPALSTIPSPVSPFFMKRNVFEYEKEARVVIKTAFDPEKWPEKGNPFGLSIPVNLKEVVLQVVVAPNAPGWFLDLVRALLKRYGLDKVPTGRSAMSVPPVMPN